MIKVIEPNRQFTCGPTWGEIQAGDGVSYADGALYIVDARAVDDGKQVTFLMRVVVPPTIGDYDYGDVVMLSTEKWVPLPEGVTYTRSNKRVVR